MSSRELYKNGWGRTEAVGSSRKFAVPLCEYYDEVEITVRQGNVRVAGPKLAVGLA